MSWWQKIFKGRVDVNNVFDKIASGVDKLAFTQEEKAEFNKDMADAMAGYAKDTLNENTVRSKTRRFIAIFMIINIMLVFWLCIALMLFKIDIRGILELSSNFNLGIVFITIIAFFFGGYYFTTYKKK